MHHSFTLEVLKDGKWKAVKHGLSATLAAIGAALASLEQPAERWRIVRDDGEVFRP